MRIWVYENQDTEFTRNSTVDSQKHWVYENFYHWFSVDWSSSWVSSWHFELKSTSSWVAHIFNSTRLNLTENWINSTWLVKNLSLTSRELNIEIFPVFCFCIIFLHYLFDRESWRKTWRLYDRESWRKVIIESHDRKLW